jgi:antibiotic biosynthesis monooxygenase (ABM) superfamily enzyme
MKAFNVVRFRVKPGEEARFLDAHHNAHPDFAGYRGGAIIRTGDRSYCFIGGWDDFDSLVAARPQMIAMLDTFRDALEDLGGGLGVSDPVSGETVVELPARTAG